MVPDIKTMLKLILVLIYGRFYITAYSQGKIPFESQMRILFNEVLGKISRRSSFSRLVKKKKGDFRFLIESDAWRVSFCFRSLCISAIL